MSRREPKGISDRSGFVYPLRRMRKEWTGLLVGPDEYEPKHPQLTIRRTPVDSKPLLNPRPDRVEPLTVLLNAPELPWQPFTQTVLVNLTNIGVSEFFSGSASWNGEYLFWESASVLWY